MNRIPYTRDTLLDFAKRMAHNDKRLKPRTWYPDSLIVEAIQGHAHAYSQAHRVDVTLTHDDLTFGLETYRRERGLIRRASDMPTMPLIIHTEGAANAKPLAHL
jgi:hypothetical protein